MTRQLMTWAAAIVCVMPFAFAATAQGTGQWKTVGNWDISTDPSIDNGCYAVAYWAGGTVLRIGRNPDEHNFYLMFGSGKWSMLRPETNYDIEIQFGRRVAWALRARGMQFSPDGLVYLHAESSNDDFLRQFQRALTMKISVDGDEIGTLRLTGSGKAWDEVEICQSAVSER